MKQFDLFTTIKFNKELETKYNKYMTSQDNIYIRVAFIGFILLYSLFAVTDYIFVRQWFNLFFIIRFFVVIPLFIVTIALSFMKKFYLWRQYILMFNYSIGGFGIAIMLILDPLNIIYYGGLFLIFTAGYFVLHLHPKYAIMSGVSILIFFTSGVILVGNGDMLVYASILFFVAENIIGTIGIFQLENYKRKEFLYIEELSEGHKNLSLKVSEQMEEISIAQISTISALAILAESRDKETGEHIDRVGDLCYKISCQLPDNYFNTTKEKEEFCKTIRLASALHDIGKVGITDAILNKPGPLNEEERIIMRTHSKIGSETLEKLHGKYPNNYFVKLGIEITHYHHEKWDGSGYPEGLSGEEIPLSARVMALADVYDALISKRPYKEPFSHERAFNIIKSEAGDHFDPEIVKCFSRIFE